MHLKLIAFVVFLLVGAVRPAAVLNLVRFNETYATARSARCMDGTTGVFYIDLGTGAGRNKWIFSIQGGGWCFDQGTCTARSTGDLGSSSSATATITRGGLLSDDLSENPDFYTWNRVWFPYCSGDLHSGTRTSTSTATWGFWFSGHNIFEAMIDSLISQANLRAATDIIVNGGSAGAVGSWLHTEYMQERFPSARVVNLPNAGYSTFEQEYPLAVGETKPIALQNMSDVWQSYIPPACLAVNSGTERYKCLITQVAFDYFVNPRFWIQAVVDTNMIESQLGFPGFTAETNNNVTFDWMQSLYASRLAKFQSQIFSRSRDGWWITSTLVHGISEDLRCNQNNITWLETFGNWYFNRAGIKSDYDECGPIQARTFYQSGALSIQASCTASSRCQKVGLWYGSTPSAAPKAGGSSPTGGSNGGPLSSSSPVGTSSPSVASAPTSNSATNSGTKAYSLSGLSVTVVLIFSALALLLGM